MSLSARKLETGQVSGANCDLARETREKPTKKAYQVLNSLLGPEWVTAKGPECAKIGVRIWVGEKTPDKEAKDKVSSNTLGRLHVIDFTGALEDPGCSAAQVCEHLVRTGSQTKHKTMVF